MSKSKNARAPKTDIFATFCIYITIFKSFLEIDDNEIMFFTPNCKEPPPSDSGRTLDIVSKRCNSDPLLRCGLTGSIENKIDGPC